MAKEPTARDRARERTNGEILRVGRAQLAEVGAAALSLRAVARELGMVSSAIYRYVESRDELLTRLIDDSYNALGDAVEADVLASSDASPTERWVSAANTVRSWAIAHPHDYSLLYGSPVPGYAAPEQTAVSGTRAARALVSIVADAHRSKRLRSRRTAPVDIAPELAHDFAVLRANIDLAVSDAVTLDVLVSWSQMFGLISFEVFGQTRGVVENHDQLFETAARRLAQIVGLH